MQIVSFGDNLHEMSNPIFLESRENIINLPSAELAQKVVKVKLHWKKLLIGVGTSVVRQLT